jgi:Bacterial capsule synthesis protein PGA_cap
MLYEAEQGKVNLALCGDIMPSSRLAVFREPEFLALREILRGADACFANLESMVVRYGEGSPTIRTGTHMVTEPELLENDVEENLRQIREARRQADWVIVSLHNQDMMGRSWLTAQKRTEITVQPDFVRDFAYRCIDAGADVFAGHGPHILMGIEIYRRKPIFYSLGNFIMQNETLRHVPAYPFERFGLDPRSTPSDFFYHRTAGGTKGHPASPEFWQSMVAVCRFEQQQLKEIELHPLDTGFGRPRPQRGRPLLADEKLGKRILERVARMSELFGTRIEQRNGRGVIHLA